jgi:hypothetical protein
VHATIIFGIKFGITKTNIEYTMIKVNFRHAMKSEGINVDFGEYKIQDLGLGIDLTWFNCVMIWLTFMGSAFWSLIGGFGLANAPISMLNSWLNRP